MNKIIVMLIYMASAGAPVPIYGFHSMDSCNKAIPEAQEQVQKEFGRISRIMCLEITP